MRRSQWIVVWTCTLLALAAAGSAAGAATTSTASSADRSCRLHWGSGPKHGGSLPSPGPGGQASAAVVGVRAGRHSCFDRVVFDGPGVFNVVQYVPAVTTDPKGDPVPLGGGAFLSVSLIVPSDQPLFDGSLPGLGGFRTLRQIRGAGGFEGYALFGVGVRARLPFRVFVVPGPGAQSRVVVDVAHRR